MITFRRVKKTSDVAMGNVGCAKFFNDHKDEEVE